MKAAFAEQIRIDTMTPMWLSKDQISTWRAAQFKDEKNRRQQGRKAANGRGTGVADAVPSAGAAPVPPPSKKMKGDQEGGQQGDEGGGSGGKDRERQEGAGEDDQDHEEGGGTGGQQRKEGAGDRTNVAQ